jgi:putative DNA primase/helicase
LTRLVIVNEIRGEALESTVMKAWTGGDKVSATPKYGHPLGFYADGTIFMVGNELPKIEFEDDAMWARVAVVHFPFEIPEAKQDRELAKRFDPQGVLAWMVRGHAEYRRIGLQPPKAATLERKHYRQSTDSLNEFWEDRVAVEGGDLDDPDGPRVSRDELYTEYEAWAAEAGIPARDRLSRETLVKRTNKRADVVGGFRWKRTGAWRGWIGLRLVKRDDEEARPLPRDGARLASAIHRERS